MFCKLTAWEIFNIKSQIIIIINNKLDQNGMCEAIDNFLHPEDKTYHVEQLREIIFGDNIQIGNNTEKNILHKTIDLDLVKVFNLLLEAIGGWHKLERSSQSYSPNSAENIYELIKDKTNFLIMNDKFIKLDESSLKDTKQSIINILLNPFFSNNRLKQIAIRSSLIKKLNPENMILCYEQINNIIQGNSRANSALHLSIDLKFPSITRLILAIGGGLSVIDKYKTGTHFEIAELENIIQPLPGLIFSGYSSSPSTSTYTSAASTPILTNGNKRKTYDSSEQDPNYGEKLIIEEQVHSIKKRKTNRLTASNT